MSLTDHVFPVVQEFPAAARDVRGVREDQREGHRGRHQVGDVGRHQARHAHHRSVKYCKSGFCSSEGLVNRERIPRIPLPGFVIACYGGGLVLSRVSSGVMWQVMGDKGG